MTGRQVPPEERKGGQGDKAVTRYQFHTKRVDEVLLAAPLRAGRGQPKTPNVCQSCQSLVTVTITASASLGLSALRAPWSIPVRLVSKQCTFVPMYFRALLNPSDTDLKANSTRTRTGTRPRKGTYLGAPRRAVRCAGVLCERPSWAPWTWRPLDPTRHMDPRLREMVQREHMLACRKTVSPTSSIHKRFVSPSPGSCSSFSLDSFPTKVFIYYNNNCCLHQTSSNSRTSRQGSIKFSTYIHAADTHTSRHCRPYIHSHQQS